MSDFPTAARQHLMHLETVWETYHNHKETMANAGFVVQIGLFAAVVKEGIWPPEWVAAELQVGILAISPIWQAWIVYFVLWAIVHVYIRWQLNNRTIAAIMVKNIRRQHYEWMLNPPAASDYAERTEDTKGNKHNGTKPTSRGVFARIFGAFRQGISVTVLPILRALKAFLSYFWFYGRPGFPSDTRPRDYPRPLADKIQKDLEDRSTNAKWIETASLATSALMLVVASFRHFA